MIPRKNAAFASARHLFRTTLLILENNLIRLAIQTGGPAGHSTLSSLHDKPSGVDLLHARNIARAKSGIDALFHGSGFEALSEQRDCTGGTVTMSATCPDGSLRRSRTFTLREGERGYAIEVILENLTIHEREVLWGETFEFSAPFVSADSEIQAQPVSYFDPKEEPAVLGSIHVI